MCAKKVRCIVVLQVSVYECEHLWVSIRALENHTSQTTVSRLCSCVVSVLVGG